MTETPATPDQQQGQPQQVPPFDQGNPYALAKLPALCTQTLVMTPEFGRVVCLTIRKPGSTDTTLLTREEALAWAEGIRAAAEQIGGIMVASHMPPATPTPFPFHPAQGRP